MLRTHLPLPAASIPSPVGLVTVVCCAIQLCSGVAAAYDGPSTHAGLTMQAALASTLHEAIAGSQTTAAADLGLFTTLALDGRFIPRYQLHALCTRLSRLPSGSGARPGDDLRMQAIRWLVAGSMIADMPSTENRHHFYCPATKSGLDNQHPILGPALGIAATLDGTESVRRLLTGLAFDLSGDPAPERVQASGPLNLQGFYEHYALSKTGKTSAEREHHLALALLHAGGVLHALQDMASPTHVRNDFAPGHLERLGRNVALRGSRFERYVSLRFGQFGLPDPRPAVHHERLADFFSSAAWSGLADYTHVTYFSPGTLPPRTPVARQTDLKELQERINGRLAFAYPRITALERACMHPAGPGCYVRSKSGQIISSYRVTDDHELVFSLDERCYDSAARDLLPRAAAASVGLLDHLLQGKLAVSQSDGTLTVAREGAAIASGTLTFYEQDPAGNRRELKVLAVGPSPSGASTLGRFTLREVAPAFAVTETAASATQPAPAGQPPASQSVDGAASRPQLVVVLMGKDRLDQPVMVSASWSPSAASAGR